MKKHRHKWELQYTYAGTLGEGLLYHCKNCSYCKEFKSDASLKRITKAYKEEINRLNKILKEL